jgi:protein-disulfide isomerase
MPFTVSRTARLAAFAAVTMLAAAPPARAQAGSPPAAPSPQATPPDSTGSRADRGRYLGADSAKITIFEFSDFQCPFCGEFEHDTFAAVDSAFLRTGRARLIYFNLPLPVHTNAWVAAEAAMCASAQGKFWPMHQRLFANQKAWSASPRPEPLLEGYARESGVDLAAFRTCTADDQVARMLVQDISFAIGHGVGSTPTFVLLREPAAGEDPSKAQRILSGAAPFSDFQKAMEELEKK